MIALTPAAAASWLLLGCAAAVGLERFAAVETGAILSPRQYRAHPAQPLGKRQGVCGAGSHPCNDIGPAGADICCPNDQYCFIDPRDTSKGACCHVGSDCGSPCDSSQYQCNAIRTVTLSSSGATATATATVITTTTVQTCCGRACPSTSMFRCASDLGGGCCGYGAQCGAGGQCFFTPSSSAAAPAATSATSSNNASPDPPPPGCTTGQIACASSLGGGCCAATQSCTLVGGRAHCAETPVATPTGSGVTVVEMSGGGAGGHLSAGATAGVAVGAVVGSGLVIGLAVWWWLRRRRRAAAAGGGSSGSSSGRARPAGVIGRIVGGGGGGGGSGGGGRVGRGEMSEENSDVLSRSGRLGGLAQDYFGPAPAMGPYSDTHTTSAVTTPGLDRGGVPLRPHEPGDIAVPVEIDSRLREEGGGRRRHHDDNDGDGNNGHERYELYGSDVGQISPTLPSPYAGGMPSPPDERFGSR